MCYDTTFHIYTDDKEQKSTVKVIVNDTDVFVEGGENKVGFKGNKEATGQEPKRKEHCKMGLAFTKVGSRPLTSQGSGISMR